MPLFYWMDLLDTLLFFFPNGALLWACLFRAVTEFFYAWSLVAQLQNRYPLSRWKGPALCLSVSVVFFFFLLLTMHWREISLNCEHIRTAKSSLEELTSLFDFVFKECLTLVFVWLQLNDISTIFAFHFSEFWLVNVKQNTLPASN